MCAEAIRLTFVLVEYRGFFFAHCKGGNEPVATHGQEAAAVDCTQHGILVAILVRLFDRSHKARADPRPAKENGAQEPASNIRGFVSEK